MRIYLVKFFYIVGVLLLSLFVHEGVHWMQYNNIEEKRIIFFDTKEDWKTIAYLDFPDVDLRESKEEDNISELQAVLAHCIVLILGAIGYGGIREND